MFNMKTKKNIKIETGDERPMQQEIKDEKSEKKYNGPGRPENPVTANAFSQTCEWFENSCEPVSLQEFEEKMSSLLDQRNMCTRKWLKVKLNQKYKEDIRFLSDGYRDIIVLNVTAEKIINDRWYTERNRDIDEEKIRIIKTAATLIKAELREMSSDPSLYPSVDDARRTDWIPESMRLFLSHFTNSKLKIESIGQCIVKAALPRSVIPPILFALAVELDLVFGSKWLIDQTNKLGFSESYYEVTRFKQGVVISEDVDELIDAHTSQSEDEFVTFVADNIDDDTITLDGKGTFHGMGVLAIITNKVQSKKKVSPIRPKKLVKVDQLVKEKGIPILSYDFPHQRGLDSVILKPYEKLISAVVAPSEFKFDALWQAAGLFSSTEKPRANWNGFMQEITNGPHPPKSKTVMLPIIDLDPKNESCVYSVLKFVISQSKRLGIKTPSVTFDQQLLDNCCRDHSGK